MSTATELAVEVARERIGGDGYTDLLLHVYANSDGLAQLAVVPVDIEDDGSDYDINLVPLLGLDGMRDARDRLTQVIATAEAYEAEAEAYNDSE